MGTPTSDDVAPAFHVMGNTTRPVSPSITGAGLPQVFPPSFHTVIGFAPRVAAIGAAPHNQIDVARVARATLPRFGEREQRALPGDRER